MDPIRIFEPRAANTITFTSLANKFGEIANSVIPFLIGLAIAFMVWGIFKYVSAAGDSEKIAEGRKTTVYGIVALFIMLAFWGFVQMIKRSLFE